MFFPCFCLFRVFPQVFPHWLSPPAALGEASERSRPLASFYFQDVLPGIAHGSSVSKACVNMKNSLSRVSNSFVLFCSVPEQAQFSRTRQIKVLAVCIFLAIRPMTDCGWPRPRRHYLPVAAWSPAWFAGLVNTYSKNSPADLIIPLLPSILPPQSFIVTWRPVAWWWWCGVGVWQLWQTSAAPGGQNGNVKSRFLNYSIESKLTLQFSFVFYGQSSHTRNQLSWQQVFTKHVGSYFEVLD